VLRPEADVPKERLVPDETEHTKPGQAETASAGFAIHSTPRISDHHKIARGIIVSQVYSVYLIDRQRKGGVVPEPAAVHRVQGHRRHVWLVDSGAMGVPRPPYPRG
jgi:hypothetical protein